MRLFLATTLVLLGTTGIAFTSNATVALGRGVDAPEVEAPNLVAWRDLADKPCRWLGKKVRVRMQFESELADWNPYLTRFGRAQFDALRGWSDEQFPWIQTEFDHPEALLFVRKGTPAQHALDDAKGYDRFEFTIQVREVFLDTPWAEILDVQPMSEEITEATVIHAARALDLMNQQAWRLAVLELDVALEAPLPDPALLELKRLRDVCESVNGTPPR